MSNYVTDFKELKERIHIDALFVPLGIEAKPNLRYTTGQQWRAPCPACNGDDRSLVITKDGMARQIFYCFKARKGGDLIGLWSHVTGQSAPEAAEAIIEHSSEAEHSTGTQYQGREHSSRSPTVPQKPRAEPTAPFDPAAFAAKLTYADELKAWGISEKDAERFEIGIYRGLIYVPLRDQDGAIAGFIAHSPDQKPKLPKSWLPPKLRLVKSA